MSKTSFQYGFRVFLMTDVVLVCSPPMVATAKGSGKPVLSCQLVFFPLMYCCLRNTSLLYNPSAAMTDMVRLVEPG